MLVNGWNYMRGKFFFNFWQVDLLIDYNVEATFWFHIAKAKRTCSSEYFLQNYAKGIDIPSLWAFAVCVP